MEVRSRYRSREENAAIERRSRDVRAAIHLPGRRVGRTAALRAVAEAEGATIIEPRPKAP